jgi:hypothetical protein
VTEVTVAHGDHEYCVATSTYSTVDAGCQTDLTGAEIEVLLGNSRSMEEIEVNIGEVRTVKAEHSLMKEKLGNRDVLRRELFLEKVLQSDTTVKLYTGLPSKTLLTGVFDVLDEREEHLKYWTDRSSAKEKSYQRTPNVKKPGPKRKLSRFDEYVLTLVRLRLGLITLVVGDLFGVSGSRASQIFTTWITYMSETFKPHIKWPTRAQVKKNMPPSFKKQYPKTRAIIDCTEFFFQRPRSPHAQSVTYSSYKSRNTGKLLISITPAGMINFVSDIYGGNASDRYITEHSGFLNFIEPGDDIMADRGFAIRDLLTFLHATLNIPPFTNKCAWGKGRFLTTNEIRKTRDIAKVRIHVDRAIQRLKSFRLIGQTIPWHLKPKINQIVTVCAFVCNLQPKLVRN